MPANTDHHALDFQLQVRPTAPVGSTELRFLDGGQVSSAEPVPNQLTVLGSTYLPEQLGSFVFIGGVLHVLPDVTIFIRGDANGDEAVNMSDALTALNYLFLGSAAPHCLDAGDTNDDGELNIADAIGLLQHLFLGGSAPAAPFPLPGEDPTADDLRCRARSG
jgi:hypothetical protein